MASPSTPADLARRAAEMAASGDPAGARDTFKRALKAFPNDAALLNSAGNFHARQAENAQAFELFERALELDPGFAEAGLNLAVVALRLDRPRAALSALLPHETGQSRSARYWMLRADAARALGEHAEAAQALREAQTCEPANTRIAGAQARLSLERGEIEAIAAHEAALAREPGNFDLMLGYIQALQANGHAAEAREFAEGLAAHFPSWLAGQAALAELRWEAGKRETYTAHFAAVVEAHPVPESYLAWADRLSGNDHHAEAAEVLARGMALWPENHELALAQAIALGEAGQAVEADRLLCAQARPSSSEWRLASARNALRLGRVKEAAVGLETLTQEEPANVAAWALLDTCWRLLDDARHQWLHGQAGLVREVELSLPENSLIAIRSVLERLHAGSAVPLGQSVKSGTQTRGALFARPEPELAELRAALEEALADYRRRLPQPDSGHPLLAFRDAPWRIAGSWSVRFSGAGRHAAHIHPRGVLSSACYLVVSDVVENNGRPGWLELGRPPSGLNTGLHPLTTIKPVPGRCILFPSTLFHGTRAIDQGERMTVAFDVYPDR